MKRMYILPSMRCQRIQGKEQLLGNSIRVDKTNKVSNSADIGFAKENKSGGYDVWDDDWSK